MIRSLVLENFRLHSHTELRFESDGQIILVAGSNGVGKSTLLESILFALYGESRHGRRNLDQLVRRGAELEGMSVELVFDVDATTYRINRRRDGRSVTAVLYGNEIPLMEGPNAVTDAVTRLLGMDSVGFKVAVIAQQKELDGLASLRPSDRSSAVRRLLRLDAITAAKDAAQGMFRHERDLVRDLRNGVSEDLNEERDIVLAARDTAAAELEQCTTSLRALETELQASADVETMWNLAVANRDRAQATVAVAEAELLALQIERAAVEIAEVIPCDDDVDVLVDEIALVERALVEAEGAARVREQRALVETELQRVRSQLSIIAQADLTALRDTASAADASVSEAIESLGSIEERIESSRSAFHRATADRDAIVSKISRLDAVGAECDTCGQRITDDHRNRHASQLSSDLAAAEATVNEITVAGRILVEERVRAREVLDRARTDAAAAAEAIAQAGRDADALAELQRREHTYADQLERLVVAGGDVVELSATRRQLDVRLEQARTSAKVDAQRAIALARVGEIDRALAGVQVRHNAAVTDAAASSVGSELEQRYQARLALVQRHGAEKDMYHYWEREHLLATERLAAFDTALERRSALERRISEHETKAVDAANAALLLGDTADRLATRIRPMLEGSMSSLLATMSGGRFDAVRIDDDYNVTVSDAGAFRPLNDLSGGEIDLVALALRLALSQAVADRAGAGAGFLILDECFGSQDPERRASVMAALRGLRDTYRQIFLISHVENIEDAADIVVRVGTDADRTEAEVTIS